MQKILGSHWKSSPKDWLLSLCLRAAADHVPYVAWQTQLISEHAARTEILSHRPVKAWPTTPGCILIYYDLFRLASKSFKTDGRMERARDEFSWSLCKGILPWPEGTNVMNCPCQTLPGLFSTFPVAQDPISAQLIATCRLTSQHGLNPISREVPDTLGWGCLQLPPSCRHLWWDVVMGSNCHPYEALKEHLYLRSSWADFPDCIIFFGLT